MLAILFTSIVEDLKRKISNYSMVGNFFFTPRKLGTSLASFFSSRQDEQEIKVKMTKNKFIVEFWNSISFLIYHVVSLQVRWNAKKWCSFESMIRSELELCLHNWSLLKSRKNHFDPIMHIQLQVKRKGSISKRWCCHWCKFTKFTVFENHRKSLIQRLHFEWTKSQKVLPDTSILIRQKLVESTKIEMRHLVNFQTMWNCTNVTIGHSSKWATVKYFFRVVATSAHELNALRMHIIDDRDTCYFKEIAYFDAY